jgi:hypothetical protein
MASRGTLPEGARSLREKKADGRAEWGRWARVYTRKLSVSSNQLPGNDVLGRSRDLAAIPPLCPLAERRQRFDRDDSKGKDNSKNKRMGGA